MIEDETGSITIWVLLVLGSIIGFLILVMTGIRVKLQKVTASHIVAQAVDESMAGYCKELFEEYGVMFCIEDNTEAGITYRLQQNNVMKDITLNQYQVDKVYATDQNGDAFKKQVCSYMEAVVTKQVIEEVMSDFNLIKQKKELGEKEKQDAETDTRQEQLNDRIEEIKAALEKLEKQEESLKKQLHLVTEQLSLVQEKNKIKEKRRQLKKAKQKWAVLLKEIQKTETLISDALNQMQQYKQQLEAAAESSGDLMGNTDVKAEDVILQNKNGLEQAEKELSQLKEFLQRNKEMQEKDVEPVLRQLQIYDTQFQGWKLVQKPLEKKKGNQGLLERLEGILEEGKLALVVDDVNKLSGAAVELEQLPSSFMTAHNEEEKENLYRKALCSQYLITFFGNYRAEKRDTALCYELEYVLGGKARDKENLSETVNQLFLVREGVNMLSLIADREKRTQAKSMAATIIGWTGIPILQVVTEGIIITVWSFAESAMDVKSLMAGNKVKLVKQKEDWQISLEKVLEVAAQVPKKTDGKGLSYEQYVRCLLLFQKEEILWGRTMDLIQFNLQTRYNKDFYLNQCIGQFRISAVFQTTSMFGLVDQFDITYEQAYMRR